jgi:hypothetical protein
MGLTNGFSVVRLLFGLGRARTIARTRYCVFKKSIDARDTPKLSRPYCAAQYPPLSL